MQIIFSSSNNKSFSSKNFNDVDTFMESWLVDKPFKVIHERPEQQDVPTVTTIEMKIQTAIPSHKGISHQLIFTAVDCSDESIHYAGYVNWNN